MRVLRLGRSPSAANGVGEAIAREELAGLAYMFWGRLIVLGMLAVWAALTLPFERSGLYLAAIAAFALLGAPPYLLARRRIGGTPVTAAFLLLDVGILTYILIVPPSFLRRWLDAAAQSAPAEFSLSGRFPRRHGVELLARARDLDGRRLDRRLERRLPLGRDPAQLHPPYLARHARQWTERGIGDQPYPQSPRGQPHHPVQPDRLSRARHRDPGVDGLALAPAGAPAGGGRGRARGALALFLAQHRARAVDQRRGTGPAGGAAGGGAVRRHGGLHRDLGASCSGSAGGTVARVPRTPGARRLRP